MRSSHLIKFPDLPRMRHADRSGVHSCWSGERPAMMAQRKAVALRAALAATLLLFFLLMIAAPASAQTGPTGELGPSGSLTVQMQVSDALTEQGDESSIFAGFGPPPPPGPPPGGCIANGHTLLFGTNFVLGQPGNSLPKARGVALPSLSCDSSVVLGEVTLTITETSSGRLATPPLVMTLDGRADSTGVEYAIFQDSGYSQPFVNGSGTPKPQGGPVGLEFPIYFEVQGPFPRGTSLPAGTYFDGLSVIFTF